MSLFLLGRSSVSFLPFMSKQQVHQLPHNILDVIQNIPCHKHGYVDLFTPQSHGASSFSFHFVQCRIAYHQTLKVLHDHVMLRGADWSQLSKVFFPLILGHAYSALDHNIYLIHYTGSHNSLGSQEARKHSHQTHPNLLIKKHLNM